MAFVTDDGGGIFGAGDPPRGVCIAFNDVTLEVDPVWTRLDDPAGYRLADGWQISRGRSGEFEKTGTGTAQVSFVDSQGLLNPLNTDGPFYDSILEMSNIEPMRQASIAMMNPVTGDWSTLFRGFISGMEHTVDMYTYTRGLDRIAMEWVDAFDLFSALELTPTHHGELSALQNFADVYYKGTPANFSGQAPHFVHVDDRIVLLLDDAGWPKDTGAINPKRAGLRNIYSGNVSLQGSTYSRRDSLLTALFDAADAEFPGVANVFMSKAGVVTFHGRFARFYPDRYSDINHWYVGSLHQSALDDTYAPLAGMVYRRTKDDIINACMALPVHFDDSKVPSHLYKNDASIAKYGWRSLNFDNLLTSKGYDVVGTTTTDTNALEETLKFAKYYVDNYNEPKTRVTQLTFRPRGAEQIGAAALWELMCGVEIGDVISLKAELPGHDGDFGFDEDFFVEGVHYNAAPGRVDMHDITMQLDVSPKSYYAQNPFGDHGTP